MTPKRSVDDSGRLSYVWMMSAMDHGIPTDPKTREKLKRSCSELSALIDRLRVAIKSRSLEQSDRYVLYTLIEKYTRRLGELERKRKLVEAEVRARNPLPATERQENHKTSTRSNSKKRLKVKRKKKRKAGYPNGVDPLSWTPDPLGRRSPQCQNQEHPMRRSSGSK